MKIYGISDVNILRVSGNVIASKWTLGLNATLDLKLACK